MAVTLSRCDRGDDLAAVVAHADRVGVVVGRVRVHEVHPRLGRQAGEHRARAAVTSSTFHCICGRFTPSGSSRTVPGRIPSPARPGASSESSYSSCMPTQMPRNGVPADDDLVRNPIEPGALERVHAATERTDSRQHDRGGLADHRRIGGEARVGADVLQRLLRRAEVADAVVEHGDERHGALGLTGCPWSTAHRRPRPRPRPAASGPPPLNVASMMWCVFLPRTSVTCSVIADAGDERAPELLDQLRDRTAGRRGSSRRGTRSRSAGTADRTGRAPRRPAPRRAAPGSTRTGARRPCRRAPRGTPHPARCRRPRRCGGRRSRDRPSPRRAGRTRRAGRAGSSMWSKNGMPVADVDVTRAVERERDLDLGLLGRPALAVTQCGCVIAGSP